MAYSKEEIEAFRLKDLRISKLAIMKELIRKLDMEVVNEPEEVLFPLVDRYVRHVYKDMESKDEEESKTEVEEVSWVQLAEGLKLAIPNQQNIKILDAIMAEYKELHKASANPSSMLKLCITSWGKYPKNKSNNQLVIETYKKTVMLGKN